MFTTTGNSFKNNLYAIITVIVLGVIICGYTMYILPNQANQEDARNMAIFKGVKQQLSDYIDSKAKTINAKGVIEGKNGKYKFANTESNNLYVDTIDIKKIGIHPKFPSSLYLERTVQIKNINNGEKKGTVRDSIIINLKEFREKIPKITNFSSFYICQLYPVIKEHPTIFSENVSLFDQDSLLISKRNNGPINFEGSSMRYYSDELHIHSADFTLLIVAGVEQSYFDSTVRSIHPDLLVLILFIVILLMLSLNFIKPVISSYRERMSQRDLVSVAFSIGALCAVLVVFTMIKTWESALESSARDDLNELTSKIGENYSKQLDFFQRNEKQYFKNPNRKLFAKIDLNKSNLIFDINDSKKNNKAKIARENDKIQLPGYFAYLDSYFMMDSKGLITADININDRTISRTYSDREYFKQIVQKKTDTAVLTAVFSREENAYQWIYAKKDGNGIRGIAFRNDFKETINMPIGTDYIIVNKLGNVLMQSDTETSIYQNILPWVSDSDNSILQSVLAGNVTGLFSMEYQGESYHVYARPLEIDGVPPLYILGLRNQSLTNSLSVFTFTNGFIIALIYAIVILFFILIYSSLIHFGTSKFFSKHHFYHLFPDNSRTNEYKILLVVNGISLLVSAVISLYNSPHIPLYSCFIIGINTAFLNLIMLTIRTHNNVYKSIFIAALVVSSILSIILLNVQSAFWALVITFSFHALIIVIYHKFKGELSENPKHFIKDNKGVNRRVYTVFLSVILLNHFAVFPFILCSAIYVTELSDISTWHCSALAAQTKARLDNYKCKVPVYGCNCEVNPDINYKYDEVVRLADIHLLPRPAQTQISKFSLMSGIQKYYFDSSTVFKLETLGLLIIVFVLLFGIVFLLILYYNNRFFFYDLIQAYYEKYYTTIHKNFKLKTLIIFPDEDDVKHLIEQKLKDNAISKGFNIETIFDNAKSEIPILLKEDFITHSNIKECGSDYENIWLSVPDNLKTILFDFTRDNFVNYKNKDAIMQLMDLGIINGDQVTGRLKIMNPNFRAYLILKSKRDDLFIKNFVQTYVKEGESGLFSLLRLPIIISSVSILVLLIYLNKDSYDRVALLGTGIASALTLVNKLLGFTKNN